MQSLLGFLALPLLLSKEKGAGKDLCPSEKVAQTSLGHHFLGLSCSCGFVLENRRACERENTEVAQNRAKRDSGELLAALESTINFVDNLSPHLPKAYKMKLRFLTGEFCLAERCQHINGQGNSPSG